ncbi:hypothetical protein AVEN_227937-1 [Araneus ventricosus]|uniref:Uncharacterized protein n=1 Tax=Araneus ventricosus TaxID=182803 RepID=A0A4Y2NN04_ARAVE|nr:hypothetical protein AVEN_97480-1 [Araneus ventricosus]GBN40168.1 hypothetical protein AVEN_227937-1 [Araneus ventricosus]
MISFTAFTEFKQQFMWYKDREDRSSHQPLWHTVSVCRKLIKESRTPPLRTVVRREQVLPLTETLAYHDPTDNHSVARK